jgi:hypothetical protein
MYTAYVLTDEARAELEEKYPPAYPNFIGHHVTVDFGVPADAEIPEPAEVKVIGSVDSGDGLQALVVSVNGERTRPDGGEYHITWSLDPEKYSPKDSNELLKNTYRYTMSLSRMIETTPELL